MEAPRRRITDQRTIILRALLQRNCTGRDLRQVLEKAGFDQSGPSFYQMMGRLERAGFVESRFIDGIVNGVPVKEKCFSITTLGQDFIADHGPAEAASHAQDSTGRPRRAREGANV